MRGMLAELKPSWILGPTGGRIGMRFLCPEHSDHEIVLYFAIPLDGEAPASMGTAGRRTVFHTGDSFETLSVGQGIDHGEDLMIFIQEGIVITG